MNKQAIITDNNVDWLITYDKDGYEKKRYCLSLDPSVFTPKFPGEICPEYMLRYCQAKGLADLEWYVNTLEELVEKVEQYFVPVYPHCNELRCHVERGRVYGVVEVVCVCGHSCHQGFGRCHWEVCCRTIALWHCLEDVEKKLGRR